MHCKSNSKGLQNVRSLHTLNYKWFYRSVLDTVSPDYRYKYIVYVSGIPKLHTTSVRYVFTFTFYRRELRRDLISATASVWFVLAWDLWLEQGTYGGSPEYWPPTARNKVHVYNRINYYVTANLVLCYLLIFRTIQTPVHIRFSRMNISFLI